MLIFHVVVRGSRAEEERKCRCVFDAVHIHAYILYLYLGHPIDNAQTQSLKEARGSFVANAKAACTCVQPDVYNIPAVHFRLLTLGSTGNTERLSDVKWSKAASLCREM